MIISALLIASALMARVNHTSPSSASSAPLRSGS
jgi:hypothetical protein